MSSQTKRKRRTREEIDAIKDSILEILGDEYPMTVRQVFYQLVAHRAIAKTEAEYKGTVVRLIKEMRLADVLPFKWISDNSRWMRKPRTHSSLASMLQNSKATYRRALWDEQDAYVEIWLEKEALSGVVYAVTREFDVPLMVTRGYPSLTFVWEAAQAIEDVDKPCYLYYFGDRDPSGEDIPRSVQERIEQFAPWADLHFKKVAITSEQIDEWDLPTRPTKRSDVRSKTFEGESVELDALPSSQLRELVRDCITRHIDTDAFERLEQIEESERDTLQHIIDTLGGAE